MRSKAIPIRLIFVIFFSLTLLGFAQEIDDLDDMGTGAKQEETVCGPDSFSTSYEYLGKITLSKSQVQIKFSYLVDYAKKKNWDKVKKYGWELIYGDKNRLYKSVYDKIADSYFYTNQPDSTLLICQMGLKEVGDRSRLHYYAGYIQFKLGRYSCAEPHYRYLSDKSPENIEYMKYLCQCLIKQDKEEAIQAQEKIVEMSNNDPKEQTILAQLSEKFGYNPMETYLKSWDTNPTKENMQTAVKITTMAVQQGRENDGIKVGLEALKIEPNNKIMLRNLADLYNAKMEFNNAITYYKKFLEEDKSNLDAYCAIANIYREMRSWSNARSYAYRAMNIDKNSGKPHIVLANIYQSSATNCLNEKHEGKINIDIKLVFQMAYEELAIAAKDPAYKVDAQNKRKWLNASQLIPNEEDYFMHKDVKKPRLECFDWLK